MSDEPYTIIHLGNPYDFVIKNIKEPETYGTFQGDNESMEEFIEKVNSIIKENDELKEDWKRCRAWLNSDKYDYELTLAFIKNKGYSLKDVLEYEKELKSE